MDRRRFVRTTAMGTAAGLVGRGAAAEPTGGPAAARRRRAQPSAQSAGSAPAVARGVGRRDAPRARGAQRHRARRPRYRQRGAAQGRPLPQLDLLQQRAAVHGRPAHLAAGLDPLLPRALAAPRPRAAPEAAPDRGRAARAGRPADGALRVPVALGRRRDRVPGALPVRVALVLRRPRRTGRDAAAGRAAGDEPVRSPRRRRVVASRDGPRLPPSLDGARAGRRAARRVAAQRRRVRNARQALRHAPRPPRRRRPVHDDGERDGPAGELSRHADARVALGRHRSLPRLGAPPPLLRAAAARAASARYRRHGRPQPRRPRDGKEAGDGPAVELARPRGAARAGGDARPRLRRGVALPEPLGRAQGAHRGPPLREPLRGLGGRSPRT